MPDRPSPTSAGRALLAAFDRIVVVNLASRTDRLREVSAQLARLGLGFDRPEVLRFDACRFDAAAGFPTPGTRGCFHSHLGVWTEALARGDERVLLLEDDLDFAAGIEPLLPAALDALRAKDWSVFHGAVLQWHTRALPREPLTPADPGDGILGAHFIAMRGPAMAAVVPYLRAIAARPPGSPEGGPMHVDGAYGWFRHAHPQFETWVATPELGFQRSSRTDIHPLGLIDRTPGLRGLAAIARRIKRSLGRR